MVHERKSQILSLILAVTLFVTGIVSDAAAENAFCSYDLYDFVGETAFCPKLFADIDNLKICEGEVFNECGGMEQQLAGLSPLVVPLYGNRISLLQGETCRHSEVIQPFCRTLDGLVTDYMHQSDGKKRN